VCIGTCKDLVWQRAAGAPPTDGVGIRTLLHAFAPRIQSAIVDPA